MRFQVIYIYSNPKADEKQVSLFLQDQPNGWSTVAKPAEDLGANPRCRDGVSTQHGLKMLECPRATH